MTIFVLLILFQIKHLLADYPLQTPYMLGKFKEKGWVLPLAAHTAVHAFMTFVIVVVFNNVELAIGLAAFDFVVHFIMDRIKASPKYLGRFEALSKNEFKKLAMEDAEFKKTNPLCGDNQDWIRKQFYDFNKKKYDNNRYFWYALGLDQFVHHITHYVIIFFMVVI